MRRYLEYSGCIDDEHISAICDYDIKSILFKAFYSEAEILNYPDPEIVFNSYFNALPPLEQINLWIYIVKYLVNLFRQLSYYKIIIHIVFLNQKVLFLHL